MAAAPGSLFVRRAAIEDLDDLVALEHLSFAPDRRRISRRQWSYLVRRGSGVTFVALEGPSGYGPNSNLVAALVATHREGGSTLRVYSLAVHPDARRRGLARLLLSEVEAYGRERGFQRVYLEVAVDNAPAIALYCSAGFATRSRLAHYYGFDEDGWRMEKDLSIVECSPAVGKLDDRAV
jgi:[ribosomal protein S18]-alanine N-acetyltransferase